VLDPGRGKTKTGYFWAIARDDRPWGVSVGATGSFCTRHDGRRNGCCWNL